MNTQLTRLDGLRCVATSGAEDINHVRSLRTGRRGGFSNTALRG